jgi:hypothetical protein
MKTPVELCNDALRIMGLRPDCTNIDQPISQSDKVFNAFYAQTRRKMIKLTRPRFACVESYELLGTPIDPTNPDSDKIFIKPQDCLYVQKVDNTDDFREYGRQIIPRRIAKNDTIYLNYVRDIVDTGLWTDEFDELMAAALAKKAVQFLTKDSNAKQVCDAEYAMQLASFNALNARDTKIKKKHHYLQKNMWTFPWRY